MGRFGRTLCVLAFACVLLGVVAVVVAEDSEVEGVNVTGWVETLNAEELEKEEKEELGKDGKEYSSMESILHWAIGHSDPEKLKVAAAVAKRLSPEQLETRRQDLKDLMERLHIPSDAELMKIAIADLHNATLSTEDRERALQELLILVEPIDNANDLDKLGGLLSIISELDRPEEELRTTAAWVLGKACQNNLVVQKQILQHKGLPRLMEMVESSSSSSSASEEAVKALYAVSAVVRNFPLAQQVFYVAGGAGLLESLFAGPSVDIRLRRKALFLLADLAEQSQQLDVANAPNSAALFNERLLKAVVKLMESSDLDTQEKALMAVRSLSKVSESVRSTLVVACQVEASLGRVKSQLQELQRQDENQAEFAKDLEVLLQEVVGSITNSDSFHDEF